MVSKSWVWSWMFWFYTGMVVRPVSDMTALQKMRKRGYLALVAKAFIAATNERATAIGYIGPTAWLVTVQGKDERIVHWIPRKAGGSQSRIAPQMEAIYREFRADNWGEL